MPIAVIVYWYGPFRDLSEFRRQVESEWSAGIKALYMALGAYNKVRYVGLSERPDIRFKQHPKTADPLNKTFFIGEIATQGVSGRRKSKHTPDLAAAEHTLISYLQPELNIQLKNAKIDDDVSITSLFFNHWADNKPACPRPLGRFPTHITYNWWAGDFEY